MPSYQEANKPNKWPPQSRRWRSSRIISHPSATTVNADEQAEQIAELNELLVHVLDEISSLKEAMYQNTRRGVGRPTRGAKEKRRHVTEEESDKESGESE